MSVPLVPPLVPAATVRLPDGTAIRVAIAETRRDLERGLMFRESLGGVAGMLFVFDRPARHAFWMRAVRIPLDLVWLDATGRIVALVSEAPPCAGSPCPTYEPPQPAVFVLETPAGLARSHGCAVGAALIIERD